MIQLSKSKTTTSGLEHASDGKVLINYEQILATSIFIIYLLYKYKCDFLRRIVLRSFLSNFKITKVMERSSQTTFDKPWKGFTKFPRSRHRHLRSNDWNTLETSVSQWFQNIEKRNTNHSQYFALSYKKTFYELGFLSIFNSEIWQ